MATIHPPRRQLDDPRQPVGIELVPMRRRHIPQVLDIERQVYPRPWTMTLFLSEIVQRSTRFYIVAKARRQVVGYAGLMVFGDEAHVTNIAVDWSARPAAGARPPARSRSGWPTTPPRACTTSSGSPRWGSARTTTPRPARTP
jgi:hypothetical protein